MQRSFPVNLLPRLCCPRDRGSLTPEPASDDAWLENGAVRCSSCGSGYAVRGGILILIDSSRLHPDSAFEMEVRDARSGSLLDGSRREWQSTFAEATEVQPTLAAVGVLDGMTVCELGCGPGRYTLSLLRQAAEVIAVDFSVAGLRVLRNKLSPEAPVALVQADVARPFGRPGAFDRMLSTLHSNLPDKFHRRQALRWMADALMDDGRAVVSMHHHSTRDVLFGTPASGRYPDSGIVRHQLTCSESLIELAPWFAEVKHQYIAARVPGLPNLTVARAVARTPLLREALSSLFLAVCTRPVHIEGAA